jgi:serine/threonine protein kinase
VRQRRRHRDSYFEHARDDADRHAHHLHVDVDIHLDDDADFDAVDALDLDPHDSDDSDDSLNACNQYPDSGYNYSRGQRWSPGRRGQRGQRPRERFRRLDRRAAGVTTNTTKIAGRYRLERRLGIGGMSTVQLAFDERLQRYVAVKLLAEHLADDESFVSRFRREALAAARLVHPNIVQVFDFGFDETAHQHFIVMERVSGQSCAELLRDRGHLDVEEAVSIITQACRGLDYAHRNGVVHRDVKPGNLLVSDTGVVKLADFGIARATDQSSITQVGSVLGTAAYLAPEQARGEEAGPRADIYSLGVVSYQLLSGRLPYEASSLSELAARQQRESPPPLNQLNPEVSAELARVVATALAIDQEARPADGLVLAEAIRAGAQGLESRLDTGPTAHLGTSATNVLPTRDATASTRVAPARVASTPRTSTPRRRPAPAPAPAARSAARRAPAREPEPAAASRSGRAMRRLLALLLFAVAFVVAVVVAVIIVTSTSSTVVHARDVATHDVQSAIKDLQGLINQYTK